MMAKGDGSMTAMSRYTHGISPGCTHVTPETCAGGLSRCLFLLYHLFILEMPVWAWPRFLAVPGQSVPCPVESPAFPLCPATCIRGQYSFLPEQFFTDLRTGVSHGELRSRKCRATYCPWQDFYQMDSTWAKSRLAEGQTTGLVPWPCLLTSMHELSDDL